MNSVSSQTTRLTARNAHRILIRSSREPHQAVVRSWKCVVIALSLRRHFQAVSVVEPVRAVTLIHAKDHPVLSHASSWSVEGVSFLSRTPIGEARVDLRLCRDCESVRLWFDGVDDFTVAAGFPAAGAGVRILDVSHLQWQGVSIRVESSCGRLGYWARSVHIGDSRDNALPRDDIQAPPERQVTQSGASAGRKRQRQESVSQPRREA